MARWRHAGGFSLEAAVRIEAEDRAGKFKDSGERRN